MAIASISGKGLAAIALAVAMLWGCFVAEQLTVRRALVENARVVYQLRQLQQRRQMEPASTTAPRRTAPVRPSAG